ncbi:MAG: hypothetical protein ACM3X4_05565 [Ignavibacteriales bacterium]
MSRLNGCNIVSRRCLDDRELRQVWELKNTCEQYDHTSIRLLPAVMGNHLQPGAEVLVCHLDSFLVGFLWMQAFGASMAELTGMVHPTCRRRRVLSDLLSRALAECAMAGLPAVECITDSSSASGLAFLAAAGASRSHSEHRMRWQPHDLPRLPAGRIRLQPAGQDDAAALAHIDAACFDLPFTIADHEQLIRQDLFAAVHRRPRRRTRGTGSTLHKKYYTTLAVQSLQV